MYKCGWNGCEKAYGTLNHLNAHVTMQSHGTKRTPEGTCPISFLFYASAAAAAAASINWSCSCLLHAFLNAVASDVVVKRPSRADAKRKAYPCFKP